MLLHRNICPEIPGRDTHLPGKLVNTVNSSPLVTTSNDNCFFYSFHGLLHRLKNVLLTFPFQICSWNLSCLHQLFDPGTIFNRTDNQHTITGWGMNNFRSSTCHFTCICLQISNSPQYTFIFLQVYQYRIRLSLLYPGKTITLICHKTLCHRQRGK